MVAELSQLREDIDALDRELVRLLAQRLQKVAEVGELKSRHGLPVWDPERESALLARRRAEAEALGVPPDLVEDVLRRAMRASYVSEDEAGYACLKPELGPIVVVGGRGRLGRLFVRLFEGSGYTVRVLEADDWARAEDLVDGAGVVLLSVPIASTLEVIRRLPPLPTSCVLADLTSIKVEPLAAMMAAHPGPVVGLHPMFGPDVPSLARQVITYCDGRQPEAYQWLLEQMMLWGAQVQREAAVAHDEAMALIQALRHFTTFAYGAHLAEEDPDLQEVLRLSSPIYRLELAMVGRLFAQSPQLYADIILASARNTDMIRRFHRRFGEALALIEADDRDGFVAAFQRIAGWFGPYAEQFLKESRALIDHAQPAPRER